MRRSPVVVVVCLLVLAGCGSDGAGGPEPAVTPASVPDGATPTFDRAQRLVPGVTADGVVAPTRLVGAHVAALRGRSFTTMRRTVSYDANGSLRSEVLTLGLVGDGHRRLFVDRRAAGPLVRSVGLSGRIEQYVAGPTTVRRTVSDGTVRYSSGRRDPGAVTGSVLLPDLVAGSTLSIALNGMNFSVTPLDGPTNATRYRLVATEVTDPETLVGLAGADARNATFTATVTADGLVSWLRLSYAADRGDGPITVVRTVAFERIGTTTVERPPWYANATAGANGSLTATSTPTTATANYASGVRSTTVPS